MPSLISGGDDDRETVSLFLDSQSAFNFFLLSSHSLCLKSLWCLQFMERVLISCSFLRQAKCVK